jgi:branched-chain amino acid transport system substrate-binding protein
MNRAKTTEGKALRDAIAATKDFGGVTGNITIDEKRNATKSAVVVEMAGNPPAPTYVTTVAPQ